MVYISVGIDTHTSQSVTVFCKFRIADLLLMNKYLHGQNKLTKAQFKLADINNDKAGDVFDLILLRKKLIK